MAPQSPGKANPGACSGTSREERGYATSMRRAVWSVVVPAVVLVLGGCSQSDYGCGEGDRPEAPRSAGRQLPISILPQSQPLGISGKEIEAALPPQGAHPSLMDEVLRRLMADTLKMAGVMGKVRPGGCEKAVIDKTEGATHRCTVIYEGFEVAWKVQFTDVDSSGWTIAHYRAWPVTGVLTADTVYAAYGWNHREKDLEPRCDRMPKIFRAEAGTATGYECQILLAQCSNGTWSFERVNQPVWINREGRVDFGEPEVD